MILPVELNILPLQPLFPVGVQPVSFRQKGDMGRRGFQFRANGNQTLGQECARFSTGGKQSRAGDRSERNGRLQFWIIMTARPMESLGPAMVKNIFPLAV